MKYLPAFIYYFAIYQQDVFGTADHDPESLSQMTPFSNFKVPGASKNWDTMTQLTPTSNISLAEQLNDHPLDVPNFSQLKSTDSTPDPTPRDELIPAKQSSSKRVRLIKQEKK